MSNVMLAEKNLTFARCASIMEGRRTPFKIGHNTILLASGPDYVVRFRNTNIIRFRPDGSFVLDNGGYRTATTKQRLNALAPRGFGVFQKKGEWFVSTPDGENVPFFQGWSNDPEERAMALACRGDRQYGRMIFADWLREQGRHDEIMGW